MQEFKSKSAKIRNRSTDDRSQIEQSPTFQFEDNRPEASAGQKLQNMMAKATDEQSTPIQRQADAVDKTPENNTGLPDQLKTGLEHLSGFVMDDVKVHYNSEKPAQLQAHAYAQGSSIHIAPGQEKHLPHEAWHVVQQKQGRVKPTVQLQNNVNINDNEALEREADVMGNAATTLKSETAQLSSKKTLAPTKGIVQRVLVPGDPVPNMAQMLGKRFSEIISGTGALPSFVDLNAAMTITLNAYGAAAPAVIATQQDCARFGIQQAMNAGLDVQNLGTFTDMAKFAAHGQALPLGLATGPIDTMIDNEVKLALHDALKSVMHQNINDESGISDLRTVVQNNIQGLTTPPQTSAQFFAVVLDHAWNAHPFDSLETWPTFKHAVFNASFGAIVDQYFDQLPGDPRQKMQILRGARRTARQRIDGWETTYLKPTHAGLADAQTALSNVNAPANMNLGNLVASLNQVTEAAGTDHLARNPQTVGFNELGAVAKKQLSNALYLMPVVQQMIEPRSGLGLDAAPVNPEWQNPDVVPSQNNPMTREEANAIRVGNHQMMTRIQVAMRKINNLVDNEVLGNGKTPTIVLHKDLSYLQVLLQKKYDNIAGFRAFATSTYNEVNVGLNEKIEVLMHEMGHLIENNLNTKEWLDIQSLLHMRHNNAPGGNQLSHVYDTGFLPGVVATILPSQARSEPAYKGTMPATGRYSAKYYNSGHTEVMSMTIEHFGSPEKANNLIKNDPLQAAIILRALQPAQFQQHVVSVLPAVNGWLP